jgi:membrane protein implicated in regulation of membrane protease activity
VIATRPLCRKFLVTKQEKTNVDAHVGKTCIVTEEIRNIDEVGEVKLGGLCWSARSADGRVIAVGEQVTVKEIQGVKLIVE